MDLVTLRTIFCPQVVACKFRACMLMVRSLELPNIIVLLQVTTQDEYLWLYEPWCWVSNPNRPAAAHILDPWPKHRVLCWRSWWRERIECCNLAEVSFNVCRIVTSTYPAQTCFPYWLLPSPWTTISSALAAEIRSAGLNLVKARMTGRRRCRAGSRIFSWNLFSSFDCVGVVVAWILRC